jgi:glycosyltransferase involved in cell wall biosynthesis
MRIVLPYCRDVPHGFYWDFLDGLSEAIRERGAEAVRFPFANIGKHDAEEMSSLYREVERGCDLFLDLCCWGYGLTTIGVQQPAASPRPILDALGVRYVGLLFDQPYFQPINFVFAERLFASFPDLGHRELAQFVFPGLRLAGDAFVPPAARAQNVRPAERDIDVLYFGNLDFSTLDRPWQGGARASVCDAVARLVAERPARPAHLALSEVLREQDRTVPPQEIADVLRALELYARTKSRHDVVTALARAGLRLVVVGRGWQDVALPDQVQRRAPLAYEEMFRLAGRSRICIDASTYFSGANDRVFNYALNGAVCFTNAAGYLRSAMGNEEWLGFYSMQDLDALAEEVRALLAEPRRQREMGEAAKRAVLARHGWRERLETILAATSLSSSPP